MGTIHNKLEFAGAVTVGPKGQVVIPVEIRDALNVKPGDKLMAIYVNDEAHQVIGFLTEDAIEEMLQTMDRRASILRQKIGKE